MNKIDKFALWSFAVSALAYLSSLIPEVSSSLPDFVLIYKLLGLLIILAGQIYLIFVYPFFITGDKK